ncbi:unnamed protein product [Gongylonema pulchrum]|uniref:PABS domain-containing protein n=1 Tax=Gongylonema pulchrum TaxID=637853 RepID=A0A183E625_9BILA|nr:unnamed protein product [Gongylonema pulchrum]
MNKFRDGWFTELTPAPLVDCTEESSDDEASGGDALAGGDCAEEKGALWPGQAFSLEVDQVLFHERSKYQDVLVFKSKTYGNVLVLDGVIQCTERDEFAYQEMLTHLAMFNHPMPQDCEIDEMVIDVSRKFLPQMSEAFTSPKLNLVIGDGYDFLKKHENEFDVILTDSSDPIGPAEILYEEEYYKCLEKALRPKGVLASQATG